MLSDILDVVVTKIKFMDKEKLKRFLDEAYDLGKTEGYLKAITDVLLEVEKKKNEGYIINLGIVVGILKDLTIKNG